MANQQAKNDKRTSLANDSLAHNGLATAFAGTVDSIIEPNTISVSRIPQSAKRVLMQFSYAARNVAILQNLEEVDMAETPSQMLQLGTIAPEFSLPDLNGSNVSLNDFAGKQALLVMFISNHCPFVKHIRKQLAAIGEHYQRRNVGIVAINSNDIEKYPADAPARMREEARAVGYTFPYLFDETQEVAKAYRAACTPDFFLFDRNRKLVYRGQLDDSRPSNNIEVTGNDLRAALDAVLSVTPVDPNQRPSIGCNIKWKPGNEPTYFRY